MPLTVRIDAEGNDRSDLSMTLQVTILSGGLILCDNTLPSSTRLSELKFTLETISKLPLGTRLNKSVFLSGFSLSTGLSESKLSLSTISEVPLGTRLNESVLLLNFPLGTGLSESKLPLSTISKLPLGMVGCDTVFLVGLDIKGNDRF